MFSEEQAQMRRDRVVAQDRMPALGEIADPKDGERAEEGERQQEVGEVLWGAPAAVAKAAVPANAMVNRI